MKHVNQSMALPIILILGILMSFMALFFIASCREQQKLQQELQIMQETRDSLEPRSHPSPSKEYHQQFPYPALPAADRDYPIDVLNRQEATKE